MSVWFSFFDITVKGVFVCSAERCCNIERKLRLTPPCEHTLTFQQPEQSRIKKKKKKEVCAARESPNFFFFYFLILIYSVVRLKVRLPRPPPPYFQPLPTNILRPSCMQTGKSTAGGMQLQVLNGAIFFVVKNAC